ncbi:MAG: hypothetical protein C0183_14955 [Roseiflexus castenholzii]|nr:MAG: hypothetical protein C0183_14955 [Roseiflexus castenholzii]
MAIWIINGQAFSRCSARQAVIGSQKSERRQSGACKAEGHFRRRSQMECIVSAQRMLFEKVLRPAEHITRHRHNPIAASTASQKIIAHSGIDRR